MSDLTCRRWTKDEKDRIYVNAVVDGSRTSVGFVDLKTGYTRADHPDFTAEQVFHAASTFAVANMIGMPAPKYAAAKTVTQMNDDLAKNKAGTSSGMQSEKPSLLKRLTGGGQDAWAVGAKGESAVGKMFDKAKDVKALHSVVVNSYGGDVDHILFTPYGIYTVNTKAHYGAHITVNSKGFFVNGTAVSHVSKAKKEAETVARTLTKVANHEIPVTPAIVVEGTDDVTVNANTGVLISTTKDILGVLRTRQTRLTPQQVAWLYEKARDPETWQW